MITKILIGVAVVLVVLVIVIATRPSKLHVERSITIAAPAETIFSQVNDFRAWGAWSPYEKKDPQMKRTFGGPPAGEGSTYAWAGDKNIGEGRMTIERSVEPAQIQIKLEFFKPFAATNTAKFDFTPAPGGGTKVTWAMDGRQSFMCKAFSLVMDMDKMIGDDFAAGLAALKAGAEGASTATARTTAAAMN
jgi:hypothetical protein